MIHGQSLNGRRVRVRDRMQARLSLWRRSATSFVTVPEPRSIGSIDRGRRLLAGEFLLAGHRVMAPGRVPWAIRVPDAAFSQELHGFAWLDDLAALGDPATREVAADWVWTWIRTFGRGRGPGWCADLTGRRLLRWINHAPFLLRGAPADRSQIFLRLLVQQTHFLARRWPGTPPGLPRFEALTGLVCAGLMLEGLERLTGPALQALAEECAAQIDDAGAVASRNPEELLEIFTLLTWAAAALSDAGRALPPAHLAAIERIAPCLRTLRHADGSLPRFHGGGRGGTGRLDHALAASGVKALRPDGFAMGYARLSAGRTTVIVDASIPPQEAARHDAHASTLAFELTSGRRPMIVTCGSGAGLGADWRRAARATPSHSTLCLDDRSSSQLEPVHRGTGAAAPSSAPDYVPAGIDAASGGGPRFEGGHDGYVASHGLTHARTLELDHDGRGVTGEDMLLALDQADRRQFDRAIAGRTLAGVPFDIRFHLHPDVRAALDRQGRAVSLVLKSGEVWEFRSDGQYVRLEPSVYLEADRPAPRATRQIVLSGRALTYATRVRWTLSKPQETATAVRDLVQDHLPMLQD